MHNHEDHHNCRSAHYVDPQQPAISRRELLAGLSSAGLLAASARPSLAGLLMPAPQVAPAGSSTAPLFRIQRVADGVYAAIARPVAMLNCNAAVIVTSHHVLVVDTHSKPSAARALISQIRTEVTDRPVRYVINSHFHWDHSQGNFAYPASFGTGTEIIASTATREWLAREGASRLRQSLGSLPNEISKLSEQLRSAKTAAEQQALRERIEALESYLKEMSPPEKQIALPNITFDNRLVIHDAGKEIHLLFLGRGHTAGDVVVYVPGERVIATGDLMHGVLPYIGDGYPDEWPRTLTALEQLDFNRVVPGHGSVQEGKSVLAGFRAYLEEITEAVARGVERGANLEELQRTLTLDRLRSLQAGGNGARIQQEMAATFGQPDSPQQLSTGVAANIADVYTYFTRRRSRG